MVDCLSRLLIFFYSEKAKIIVKMLPQTLFIFITDITDENIFHNFSFRAQKRLFVQLVTVQNYFQISASAKFYF